MGRKCDFVQYAFYCTYGKLVRAEDRNSCGTGIRDSAVYSGAVCAVLLPGVLRLYSCFCGAGSGRLLCKEKTTNPVTKIENIEKKTLKREFSLFGVFSFNILFLVWELIISILKIIHKKFQRQTFIFEIFMFMRSIKSCYIFQRLSDTFQAAFCLDWLILYTKRIQSRIVIN